MLSVVIPVDPCAKELRQAVATEGSLRNTRRWSLLCACRTQRGNAREFVVHIQIRISDIGTTDAHRQTRITKKQTTEKGIEKRIDSELMHGLFCPFFSSCPSVCICNSSFLRVLCAQAREDCQRCFFGALAALAYG